MKQRYPFYIQARNREFFESLEDKSSTLNELLYHLSKGTISIPKEQPPAQDKNLDFVKQKVAEMEQRHRAGRSN